MCACITQSSAHSNNVLKVHKTDFLISNFLFLPICTLQTKEFMLKVSVAKGGKQALEIVKCKFYFLLQTLKWIPSKEKFFLFYYLFYLGRFCFKISLNSFILNKNLRIMRFNKCWKKHNERQFNIAKKKKSDIRRG